MGIYPIFRQPHHEIGHLYPLIIVYGLRFSALKASICRFRLAASHRTEWHRSGFAPSEAHLDRLTGVKTTCSNQNGGVKQPFLWKLDAFQILTNWFVMFLEQILSNAGKMMNHGICGFRSKHFGGSLVSPILSSAQGVQKTRKRHSMYMFRTVHADCPIPCLATFIHVKTVRRNKSLKKATLYISSMSVECFTAPQFQAHMSSVAYVRFILQLLHFGIVPIPCPQPT